MTLPKGWTEAKLCDFTVARVDQGEPGATPVPYIDIGSIDRDSKRVGKTEKVTRATAPTRARQWVKAGDVLVSLTRPNLNAVALVPAGLNGAVASTGFDVLRPEGVLPEWVFNRVRSQAFVTDVCEGVQGVVYPAVRPRDVRGHVLPIPPVQEQRRIIDAIDSYLSRLDAAVASLERVQAKLKAYRASVLKAAVEGRLVPTEASLARVEKRDYEPAEVLLGRIVKERRRRWEEAELTRLKATGNAPKDDKWKAKYEEPVSPDTTRLPELPEGWCWVTVDQLAGHGDNTLCDGPFGSNLKTEHYFARLRKHEVLPGDLLVASLGTELPRACRVPDWLGPAIVKADCLRFAVNPQLAQAQFVLHALNSPPTRRRMETLVHGVGRPRIGLSLFRTTAVPVPPRAEQARITALVELLVSTSSVIQRSAALDGQRCARLRQAVLKWAFEGKFVDQDPADEPAEKLLASMRAERAAVSATKKTPGRRARGAA